MKPLSLAGSALVLPLVLFAAWVAPASAAAPAPASPQVALDWNLNAVTAVRAARTMDGVPVGLPPRPFYQPEGLVYMSYVQAAVYDAVMKISHRYELYHHFSVGAGNASPESAVISASYNTLVFYLGDPGGVLATKYAASIAALPHDKRTARGIAVGEAAAADIEQLRAGDGRNAPVSDACPTPSSPPTPGAWLCNPAAAPPQFEVTPWLAGMRPFLLQSSSQFRAPAPPALDSALYIANFNETRAFGDKNSTVRSPDETAVAWFWLGNVIDQFNATLRGVAMQHNLDLVDTVRLLVMGVMVPADALINCFDSKYHYLFWRPITAIRADGNPADASWTPLAATPNHPEYPSAHGCATSALGSVLADVLATTSFNVTMPGAQNGSVALTTTRTYATEADLDSELVNARVWIGYHFRNSVLRGEDLGHSAAAWSLQRFFLPQDKEGGD
ncbi:MAG TPA: vanadium-dependent haloperoxidase [Candidatus Dormibacteraeota bacterium]